MTSNSDTLGDLPDEIIKELEGQFPWAAELFDKDADCPEWYGNVFERLLKTISPNLYSFLVDDDKAICPEEAGELMGLVYSFMTTAGDIIRSSDDSELAPKNQFLKTLTALSTGNTSTPIAAFKPIVEKIKELTGEVFNEVITKDPGRLPDFTDAFSSATKKGILSKDGTRFSSESEATQIYTLLFVFGQVWQEKLQSLDELHRLLCHCLGSNVVGDFERLRKLCNRVKYSIGERGRSPKRKRDIEEIALSVFEGFQEAQARLDEDIK